VSGPDDAIPRVQALRRVFLRSLLSFRPFIPPVCGLAREVLPAGPDLLAAIAALQRAALDLDGGEPAARQEAFAAAREDLTTTLVEADAEGLFADLVVADLIDIEAGQRSGLSMKLEPPTTRSLPFLRYITTVRRNHLALWTAQSPASA